MNITHLNKSILILFLLVFANEFYAQNKIDKARNFALSATITNGFLANINYETDFTKNIYYSPSARLLWKPNHKLNIGIESGYLTISKIDSSVVSTAFGNTSFKARLNALPLLLVFNMNISKIQFYYGIGLSRITSRLEAFNDKVVVRSWYYCYNTSIAYSCKLSKNIELGIEAKSYFFPKLQKISGGAVVNLSYNFLKW